MLQRFNVWLSDMVVSDVIEE